MARYLTTTLPYVNADPHVGFALEIIQADALARAWRLQGEDVFFSTGTDEHGQKIFETAEKKGQDVQAYVDHYAAEFEKLKGALNISNDAFIRTTSDIHVRAAQEMWKRCNANGDIYKKSYTGQYCVGCEAYKTERDLNEEGKCALHPNLELQTIEEENYFFKFSKYEGTLLQYLSQEGSIVPSWRREEAINFVKSGLEDFSISRQKEKLSWGIPVPDDESQVMYVWFDALTSYISTLGWPESGKFEKYWADGTTVQMAGKDQVRFQSLMWQAMLMSAGIKNTDSVFYHGFITSGGQKMSKSLGNVISPYELVEKYGTDATRYMLLRHVHPVEDSDVTWERMDEWYTANLVNGLGNLVSRVMKLAETYDVVTIFSEYKEEPHMTRALSDFQFNDTLGFIWQKIQATDLKITTEEPFKVIKKDEIEGKVIIQTLVNEVYTIAKMLWPFMPNTAETILKAVKENKKPENLFPRLP